MSIVGKLKIQVGTNAELQIDYTWSPGTPDVYYLPNGDPGYPGDPEELEWSASLRVGGVEVPLDEDWLKGSWFEDQIAEDLERQRERDCPDMD